MKYNVIKPHNGDNILTKVGVSDELGALPQSFVIGDDIPNHPDGAFLGIGGVYVVIFGVLIYAANELHDFEGNLIDISDMDED